MTDLRDGEPEGRNHPPCTIHLPSKIGTGEGPWGRRSPKGASGPEKAEKWGLIPSGLPLLEALRAAIIGGTRIWTSALLRPTSLARAGAIILWWVLRRTFRRVLGEVRWGRPKGPQAAHPTGPHSGSAHLGAHTGPPSRSHSLLPPLDSPVFIARTFSAPRPTRRRGHTRRDPGHAPSGHASGFGSPASSGLSQPPQGPSSGPGAPTRLLGVRAATPRRGLAIFVLGHAFSPQLWAWGFLCSHHVRRRVLAYPEL